MRTSRSMLSMMMMIAFMTIHSVLVPLIEGLCAQILYFRFEIINGLRSHLLLLFFERKNMLKKKTVSPRSRWRDGVFTVFLRKQSLGVTVKVKSKQLRKMTESSSEVCMCGVSNQQWPSTQITCFRLLVSDYLFCLKGHVSAHGSMLWRHQ